MMKKFFTAIIFCFIMTCAIVGSASATVVYDEGTNRYFSTSEEDGMICFNSTALTKDEIAAGDLEDEGRYLENLIPTDEDLMGTAVDASDAMTRANSKYSFNYTPDNERLMLQWNSSASDSINVEVMDAQTGEVIARGYNLNANQSYKSAFDVSGRELCITVSTNALARGANLEIGSSNSKRAEDSTFSNGQKTENTLLPSPRVGGTIKSSSVPRNIDGNQGKIIGNYTTKNGHVELYTVFSSSSDKMTSINLAWEFEGIDIATEMNISLHRSITTGV